MTGRVRIELSDGVMFSLVGESRAEVLQDLADWLEAHDDDQDLTGLAGEIIAQREEAKRGERS